LKSLFYQMGWQAKCGKCWINNNVANAWMDTMSYGPGIIEQYEKRFGIIAIEKGFITPNDFINAISIQVKKHNENGTQRFIREILLDQEIMSIEQIAEVCEVLFKR